MIEKLLQLHRESETGRNPEKLLFTGVGECDVYNPTAKFEYDGKTMFCARVEMRDSEQSEAVFFIEAAPGTFSPAENIPRYVLQDPFITKISGGYLFGGTEIFPHPEIPGALSWHTKFYYGSSLEALEELTVGPEGMKDIRLVELKTGKIGVFTRPQGKKGGRGKIGFTIIDSLKDLTIPVMEEAPLLPLFTEEEWGGVNEPFLLLDGKIGVLGHIANFSEGDVRHYYSMTFLYHPDTGEISKLKIIAERADFLEGPYKRSDLEDVLFSGGLVAKEDGTADLYVGVSDCEVQKITINNPFQE